MICNPCRNAADFFAAADNKEDVRVISTAVLMHEECDNPATCPCLHRVRGKSNLAQEILPPVLVRSTRNQRAT